MLKNISNLGKTLNKAEQKEISGGKLFAGNCSQDWECGICGECLNNQCYVASHNLC